MNSHDLKIAEGMADAEQEPDLNSGANADEKPKEEARGRKTRLKIDYEAEKKRNVDETRGESGLLTKSTLVGKKSATAKNDKEKAEAKTKPNDKVLESKRLPRFPCCFYIPLDIAMEGFALFDIVYYSFLTLVWSSFLALEPFSGRDPNIRRNSTLGVEYTDAVRNLYLVEFANTADPTIYEYNEETSTTLGPMIYNPEEYDYEKMARVFSKIAYRYREFGQDIEETCGKNYYIDYLFTNELDITRQLFDDISFHIIAACVMYIFLGLFLLTTICCFRGYIYSKIFTILLWYAQLIPTYVTLYAIIMSQSFRLCILEHGTGKHFRGQKLIFWFLLLPLISYKPYEIFIWSNYVKLYFHNKEGILLDEGYFSPAKTEERQRRLAIRFAGGFTDHRTRLVVGKSELFRKVPKHDLENPVAKASKAAQKEGDKNEWTREDSSSND